MLSYGKQSINQNDIDSVIEVLKSDFLTQGPQVPILKKTVSKYCNSKFAVAVNSATSALHFACIALGLKKMTYYGLLLILLLPLQIVVYIVEL